MALALQKPKQNIGIPFSLQQTIAELPFPKIAEWLYGLLNVLSVDIMARFLLIVWSVTFWTLTEVWDSGNNEIQLTT